jgi:Domain of unknown function (DUF5610)
MSTIGQVGAGSVAMGATRAVADDHESSDGVAPVGEGDSVKISANATTAEIKHQTDQQLMRNLAAFMVKFAKEHGDAAAGLDGPLSLTEEMLSSPLGQRLKAIFDDSGVDISEAVGVDYSAEPTAARIVDFATSLFGTFQAQHPELAGDDLIGAFEKTVRDAVDAGYGQARSYLDGKGVPNEVVSLGEETMRLVHEKFDTFFENLRSGAST